jgi:hypothetical protein
MSSAISLSIVNLRSQKETALGANEVWINKNPDFQREYDAWDDKMKTRFIETILIGRAMNPIWTILNPYDNSEEVLDGMHRLTTALDYLNNKFRLNSKHFTEPARGQQYDNKLFSELNLDDQQRVRKYNFVFNCLDSTYKSDVNKRRDMYEILNRSSRTLNDYEFNKVLYGKFFDIISLHKDDLNKLFFRRTDKRGELQTEIIDVFVLSGELPNSWSSVHSLCEKYYEDTIGRTQESVSAYMQANEERINEQMIMMKKIVSTLNENMFFSSDKKIRAKNYLPYKLIIGRLMHKFKDISRFNRHIVDILQILDSEITGSSIHIQTKLDCTSRNASFQKKLINIIDSIIDKVIETNKDKRYFPRTDVNFKLNQQNNACAICKLEKEKYEGDHIIPWASGGKTVFENLQVLCSDCHRKKPTS